MADPATDPADLPAPAAAFCRSCGYALQGLPTGRCPECGRAFDWADRRTVARRPPRLALRWWAWRVGVLAVVLTLAVGSVPGWYWFQWHREQAVIDAVRGANGIVNVKRVDLGGAAKFLPARWAFLRDRAVQVELADDGTAVLDRHDLRPLAHVHYLWLANGRVTDAALAQLRGMTRLERLILQDNPRLDGSGLRHLAACRSLTSLDLRTTGLTDAGLAEVGKLAALTYLDAGSTPVTDAGSVHLAGLKALRNLYLDGTGVTDAGLVPLRGLTSLRYLVLGNTKVTEQGRRDLRKALPNLRIIDWPPAPTAPPGVGSVRPAPEETALVRRC